MDKSELRMKPDEEGITHMTKAKLSKGFELIGEHIFPLQKCERGAGAGGKVGRASCGRRLKSRDVSDLSDKISVHKFSSASALFSSKMTSYPHTHVFHGEHKTVVISGPHIQLLNSKYATRAQFAGLSLN